MPICPAQPRQNGRRHQIAHIAAQAGHGLDISGTDIHPAEVAHEEYGLDIAAQFAVHQRHLKLVVKIGKGAQTAQNGVCAPFFCVIHQQAGKRFDFNARHARETLPRHVDPLLKREKRGFQVILSHSHNDGVENFRTAPDDADMPIGQRIKGAGVDGNAGLSHGGWSRG